MVRNYQKKGAKYTVEQKYAVLEALKTASLSKVSRDFGIPRMTIKRWIDNPKIVLGSGNTTELTPREEELLAEAINYCSSFGFPQTREKVKDIIQNYVSCIGKRTAFKDGRPGSDWVRGFEKCHRAAFRRRRRD